MTTAEKEQFNSMVQKVDEIHRGLYGDKANGTEGLIARQKRDEERYCEMDDRVKKLESFKSFQLKAWGTFWTMLGSAAGIFWDKLKAFLHL
ncbi:MAG: hypothetical protein AAF843_20165 [Bacteroidota bacterium]